MSKKALKEIGDAIELFESAYNVVPSYDSETGNTSFNDRKRIQFTSVRKLKGKRADYRPGPVKVYTEQEIEDYVKSQTLHGRD